MNVNYLAVDTETTGLEFFDEAFGFSFCSSTGDSGAGYLDLRDERSKERAAVLVSSGSVLLFHNAKFDLQKFQLAGLLPRSARPSFHDTEALAHLLDEHQVKRLKPLAAAHLGEETDEAKVLMKERHRIKKERGFKSVSEVSYADIPREVLEPYAIKDAEFTYRLFELFWPQLQEHEDLMALYELERELTWALLDMEWAGLKVDPEYTETKAKEYAGKEVKAKWAMEEAVGMPIFVPEKQGQKTPEGMFNPNSNPQLRAYFESKGFNEEKYDKASLSGLQDPLARALLDLRGAAKVRGTYLLPMLREAREGILHPHFRQHGTVTGRMSSGAAEG